MEIAVVCISPFNATAVCVRSFWRGLRPVEQSTTPSSWLWTIAFRVSPVTENAFV